MPNVVVSPNRVRVHLGNYWQLYDKYPERFKNFRRHDVGRDGYTYRMTVQFKRDGEWKWITYAWEFSREQVEYDSKSKRFIVYDRKAYYILRNLRDEGYLKGYKIVKKFRVD